MSKTLTIKRTLHTNYITFMYFLPDCWVYTESLKHLFLDSIDKYNIKGGVGKLKMITYKNKEMPIAYLISKWAECST